MSFIVAIDGPAGAGKGCIAQLLSQKYGLLNIDTGAMYRTVALKMKRNNIGLEEEDKIKEMLKDIKIELENTPEGVKVFLDGENVSDKIRTEEISKFVSPVSAIAVVREKLVDLQRKYGESGNVILEGRDIGSVVFPNADVKVYLDATPSERAKRRVLQNKEKGIESDFSEVLEQIKIRDKRDSTREISPLVKAEDAVVVDSTLLTREEVVEKISELIDEKKK